MYVHYRQYSSTIYNQACMDRAHYAFFWSLLISMSLASFDCNFSIFSITSLSRTGRSSSSMSDVTTSIWSSDKTRHVDQCPSSPNVQLVAIVQQWWVVYCACPRCDVFLWDPTQRMMCPFEITAVVMKWLNIQMHVSVESSNCLISTEWHVSVESSNWPYLHWVARISRVLKLTLSPLSGMYHKVLTLTISTEWHVSVESSNWPYLHWVACITKSSHWPYLHWVARVSRVLTLTLSPLCGTYQ